jgi:hypothetical protein
MRIGVISDTHIPERASDLPLKILEEFKGVDMIIHAGDFASLEVLNKLKTVCKDVIGVYGNMDPKEIREKLPQKDLIEVKNYRIGVMHGYGAPDKLISLLADIFKTDDVDIIIFGHSHRGFNEKIGGILFFNPGSATDRIFSPYNSYGIIEINDKIEARIVKI